MLPFGLSGVMAWYAYEETERDCGLCWIVGRPSDAEDYGFGTRCARTRVCQNKLTLRDIVIDKIYK